MKSFNQSILETIISMQTKKETINGILDSKEGNRCFKLEIKDRITIIVKLSNQGMNTYFYCFAVNPELLIMEGEFKEVRDYILSLWEENSFNDIEFKTIYNFLLSYR